MNYTLLFHIRYIRKKNPKTKKGFQGTKTQFLKLKENNRDLVTVLGWMKRNGRTFDITSDIRATLKQERKKAQKNSKVLVENENQKWQG